MKDVIIILGGGIEPDGSLPESPKLRVNKGAELFKSGVAPRIIMSGKWGFWLLQAPPRTEAEAMKEYAVSIGVPEEAIYAEKDSIDTIGNAYFCKINFLEPNNWKKVLVVTADYHATRTGAIFEKILGDDYELECVSSESGLSPERMAAQTAKEAKTSEFLKTWFDAIAPGDTEAIKKLMYTKHPGYAENPEITKEQLLKLLGRS